MKRFAYPCLFGLLVWAVNVQLWAGTMGVKPGAVAQLGTQAIGRQELYEEMYKVVGRKTLIRLLGGLLVEEELKRRGLSVTAQELEEAYLRAEKKFLAQGGGGTLADSLKKEYSLTPQQYREQVLKLEVSMGKLIRAVMNVNDADLANFFFANRKKYNEPERVLVRHILIRPQSFMKGRSGTVTRREWGQAHQQAMELRRQLSQGANFGQLARQFSQNKDTAAKGGEIGWVARGSLAATMERAVFSLRDREISTPIKTVSGYEVIQRLETRKAQTCSYSDVKERLRDDYLEAMKKSQGEQLVRRLYQQALQSGRLRITAP